MYKTIVVALFFVAFVGYVHIAHAERDAERAALHALVIELAQLKPIIERAERESDPSARVKFQYAWLRADLERVRSGISAYLNQTRLEPRTLSPLHGDYSR